MSYKDILAMLMSNEGEDSVIALAGMLAREQGKHPTALLFEVEPTPIYAGDAYMAAQAWAEISARAREGFADEVGRLKARLKREPINWTVRSEATITALIEARAGAAARYADLTIMGRPTTDARMAMLEGALFGSGRPVLIAPPDWKGKAIGRNVVVGWNAKREAARALADARPLLEHADSITIVTIEAKPSENGHSDPPGADVAAHLARAGLRVDIRNVDAMGRLESAALIDECVALDADLLVIGGYGHARLAEFIFGGVTRDLIRVAPLPLLLSH